MVFPLEKLFGITILFYKTEEAQKRPKKELGVNSDFPRRKVGVSSEESPGLLRGKSEPLKSPKNRTIQGLKEIL